ncbi:hypothetical protein AAFN86_29030 [Roseomonas sp. CAU 1739]|uniref:hypothetical protein n=1 Tax=Roseomonas sp. CAU 1739 TaxID=3140364 RepID=UPI00325A7F61
MSTLSIQRPRPTIATRTLARSPAERRVRVPVPVLMRLQPMTARGVIFVTIGDEYRNANVVVYSHVAERDRGPLPTSQLLVLGGRVERED